MFGPWELFCTYVFAGFLPSLMNYTRATFLLRFRNRSRPVDSTIHHLIGTLLETQLVSFSFHVSKGRANLEQSI